MIAKAVPTTPNRTKLGVLFLFVLLVLLQMLPLTIRPANTLNDTRDCLLNTWIQARVQHQLQTDPLNLFDAGIFHPHSNTLAFSEHFLPQALVSLPVGLFFNNPILVYNFIFFFSCLLNAFGTFLLVRHLTKSDFAGVICGIMFAFNTYQINQLTHLQLFSSGLIPLSLLYLHKYLEKEKAKDIYLFFLFFTLQALACIYYGLFFVSLLILIFPLAVALYSRHKSTTFLTKSAIPFILSTAILGIFSLPYLSVIKIHNFQRALQEGASLLHYLAVEPGNWLFGKILSPLGRHEHYLFPGFAALIFAGFFVTKKMKASPPLPKILKKIAFPVILFYIVLIIMTVLTGGFSLNLGLASISSHNISKLVWPPFLTLLILILTSVIRYRTCNRLETEGGGREDKNFILYSVLGIWTMMLSFGGAFVFLGESFSAHPLPFRWFYQFVPGFKGIRVPSRYAIFVILGVIVLAGYGLKHFQQKIKNKKLTALAVSGLILFVNFEYLAVPHQSKTIPTGKGIPATYTWLKDQPGDFAVIELPFFKDPSDEAVYMYFSLFHKKRLANGYSGFIPSSTEYLRRICRTFPSRICLESLSALGIKYVILHANNLEKDSFEEDILQINNKFKTTLKLIKTFNYPFNKFQANSGFFGRDRIYELTSQHPIDPPESTESLTELPASEWTISAGSNTGNLAVIKDQKLETIWSSRIGKSPGEFLLIEFQHPRAISLVSLALGQSIEGFAQDIALEVSLDGVNWKQVRRAYYPGEFTLNLIHDPSSPVQKVYLGPEKIKYIKMIQRGPSDEIPWSVAEIRIFLTDSR